MSGRDPFRYLTWRARDADWSRRRGGAPLTPGLVIVRLVMVVVVALVVMAVLAWFASGTGSGEAEATPTFEAPVLAVVGALLGG
jgi:flagellar basal body-associated protein FliL